MAPLAWISTLATLLLAGSGPSAPATGTQYEALAQSAVRTQDVGTVLAPFVDNCDGEKRDLDKARCRAVQAYLRRTLPQQTFALGSEDPAAIEISEYDAGVKGYHVALAGCVACTKPVSVGRNGAPRFVTVKVPDKTGETLAKAVPVSRNTFGFGSLAEARRWLEQERPFMRAEFLAQPQASDADWTFKSSQGVAMKLVGARIYNRCTGQVLVSSPPSAANVERPPVEERDPSCRGPERVAQVVPPEDLPLQLSTAAINEGMAAIRPAVFECFKKHHVPGRLELNYVVSSNGTVQSVVLGPVYAGTPTGQCALQVAKDARFTQFRIPQHKFMYPFFLRD